MNLTLSLFEWMKTFKMNGNSGSVQELCDGVAMAQVLTIIAPEFFKKEWLSKIEFDVGTNWRLRVSNLRKIYEGIVDFYSEVLDKQINDKLLPNVTVIGRDHDLEQLTLLLQLILGCAINCEHKDYFIEVMKNLDFEVQHGLRTAIQQLETIEDSDKPVHNESESVYTNDEIRKIRSDKEEAVVRCEELKLQCHKLNDEKHVLQIENEKLIEKLKSLQLSSDPNSFDNEAVFQRLSYQIVSLQNDLSKMEELKEDYRLNAELKESEIIKYRLQIEQLQSKLNELKHDRDELDRLRYLSEEVERYKAMIDVHKKKIEELHDTKRQLKSVEERNNVLTKQICELEEETKKVAVFKGQIEMYKKQFQELRHKNNEESYRADKAEDEVKRLAKKYDELMHEKDKLNVEISALKVELSRHNSANLVNSMDVDYSVGQHPINTVVLMPKIDNTLSDMNEKIIRLEFENDKLKQKLTVSDDERVKLLESQLEDEKLRVIDLEGENRLINQKIIQLEGQIADIQSNGMSDDEQMQTFQEIIKQKEITLESTKNELNDAQLLIANLKQIIAKKEEELTEKDDQYKKCVNKAKVTLNQLTDSFASGNSISSSSDPSTMHSSDINYFKQLLNQKEVECNKIKADFENSLSFREMEERLMTIAFHNLSSHLQRKSAEERIRNGSQNSTPSSSFLARQRQASTRRYNMPGVSQRCNCYETKQNTHQKTSGQTLLKF